MTDHIQQFEDSTIQSVKDVAQQLRRHLKKLEDMGKLATIIEGAFDAASAVNYAVSQIVVSDADGRGHDMEVVFHPLMPGKLTPHQAREKAEKELERVKKELERQEAPRAAADWCDDDGAVLWFLCPEGKIVDPPHYVGAPSHCDWPFVESDVLLWVPLPRISSPTPISTEKP